MHAFDTPGLAHGRVPLLAVALVATAIFLAGDRANAQYTESPAFGTGATIAVAWGDCDGDGDWDLAVVNYGEPNALYRNDGTGQFTEEPNFGGGSGATFAVVWGDVDNDGDSDLAVGNGSGEANALYLNNGDGTFVAQAQFGAAGTTAMAFADFDRDGDLDLAVGNGILGTPEQNQLFVNNGDGTFTERDEFGVGETGSVAWADVDGDGDPDLAVANGGFHHEETNALYVNNGDGTFTARLEFGDGDSASLSWADADADGDIDLAVGNWNGGRNRLYLNDGAGNFTGGDAFGARDTNTLNWGDADGDGDLDVAVGNGDFSSADLNDLYLNDGSGVFTESAAFGQGSTDAVAWADADADGDLDLACGNEHSPAQNYLYAHDGVGSDALRIRLQGRVADMGAGYSNRDGVGARIAAFPSGHLGDPASLLAVRELQATGGFASQNAPEAVFALPGQATVDLRITWPGSQGGHIVQDLADTPTGQTLTVVEDGGVTGAPAPTLRGASLRIWPNPSHGDTRFALANARPGATGLRVYDVGGRLVRVLNPATDGDGWQARWDGRDRAGDPAPSGVYLVENASGRIRGRVQLVR